LWQDAHARVRPGRTGTKEAETDTSSGGGAAARTQAGITVLRGGTVAAVCAGVLGVVLSTLWGWDGAVGFALGALLATAALAVGPLLLHASRTASPPAVTVTAGLGYAGVVVLLGLVFVALGPLTWLSASHLAAALVAVTVAGLAGQVWAVARLRVLMFGSPGDDRAESPREPGGDEVAHTSQQAGPLIVWPRGRRRPPIRQPRR
jgi:hypothetical protein